MALAPGTSDAYSILFKLLCNPGDRVLIPRPSYPLFDYLARLDGVEAAPYGLTYDGRWSFDLDSIVRGIDPRTRAILVVAPNNPTGSYLHHSELGDLVHLCGENGLALIGDEVFADYPIEPDPTAVASVLIQSDVLTFGLGGLSKTVGLPQVKLSWIGLSGPADVVAAALWRLELICDTYLWSRTRCSAPLPAS